MGGLDGWLGVGLSWSYHDLVVVVVHLVVALALLVGPEARHRERPQVVPVTY